MTTPTSNLSIVDSIWPEVRIADVLTLINGRAFKPAEWAPTGTPIIRIQNLNNPHAAYNYYRGELPGKFAVADGDLLFAWSGTPGTSFGAHIWRGGRAWLNQHIFKVLFDSDRFDTTFLQLAINQNLAEYVRAAHGAAGLAHITKGKFEQSVLPCPTLTEQRQIVAEIEKQFTRIEGATEALKRIQGNLKRYRAAVLDAAIRGRIGGTESDRSHPTEPSYITSDSPPKQLEKWTWHRLEELASPDDNSITDGPFGSNLKTEHYKADGPRVIRLQNIGGGVFIDEAAHISEEHFLRLQRHRVYAGDLVIAAFGSDPPRACVIPETVGPAIVKADCIRFKPDSSVDPRYLTVALNSPTVRRRAKAFVHGIGRPRLNLREIKSILVPLPPFAEQQRIVAEVERRLSVIDETQKFVDANLQRAARLRQSILERAFTGRLVQSNVTEKSAAKTKEMSPASRRHFLRAVLSAEIVHQLHAEPTFGQTKHQKIFHLCEHIAEITDFDVQYHRDAAGPYDNHLIYANEAELKRQKWYESYSRKKAGHGYRPLAKAGGHKKYLERYWPEKLEAIRRLIQLMRHWDTEQCEIFSTAYAAWNDLLLWGQEASDDAIVHEILHRWHERKQRISEERWRNALGWMRKRGFVPKGFGKPTAAARS